MAAACLLALAPPTEGGGRLVPAIQDELSIFAASEQLSPFDAGQVAAILLACRTERRASPEQVGRRLFSLGSPALPAILEVMSAGRFPPRTGEPAPSPTTLSSEERSALQTAVELFGRGALLPIAQAAVTEEGDAAERRVALDALSVVGLSADLELAISLATLPDSACAETQWLLSRLQITIEGMARRDPGLARTIERQLRSASLPVAIAILRGFAASDDPERLSLLAAQLDRGIELALPVLPELGQAARYTPRPLDSLILEQVRDHLGSEDPLLIRAAAGAAAELGDFAAFDQLVELLSSPSSLLQEAGLRALQRLSGLGYGADPLLWQAWRQREASWFEERADGLLGDLQSAGRARVTGALHELAGHRFRRDEIAAAVARVLAHPDPEVRRLACSTLASLGSGQSAPELVNRLEDHDPGVARSAWQALRSVSGKDLPLDRAAWIEGLGLTPAGQR